MWAPSMSGVDELGPFGVSRDRCKATSCNLPRKGINFSQVKSTGSGGPTEPSKEARKRFESFGRALHMTGAGSPNTWPSTGSPPAMTAARLPSSLFRLLASRACLRISARSTAGAGGTAAKSASTASGRLRLCPRGASTGGSAACTCCQRSGGTSRSKSASPPPSGTSPMPTHMPREHRGECDAGSSNQKCYGVRCYSQRVQHAWPKNVRTSLEVAFKRKKQSEPPT